MSTEGETTSETTLVEEIKKYKTDDLINFLKKKEDLQLNDVHFKILREQEITGYNFLELTKEDFLSYGLKGGTATTLAKFVKECKEQKKKAFSSYRSLKEVLAVQVEPSRKFHHSHQKPIKIDDNNKELEQCLTDIKRRLRTMGSVIPDSKEAMRCKFISAILHSAIILVQEITKKDVTLDLQFEVVGEDSTDRVDYAIKFFFNSQEYEIIRMTEGNQHQVSIGFAQNIKQCESALQTNKKKRKASEAFECDYIYGIVTTAIDWYFILYKTDGISCTSKPDYHLNISVSALENDTELRKNLKHVMSVIVGLLKMLRNHLLKKAMRGIII